MSSSCAAPLASYASNPEDSRGRLYEEEIPRFRTAFQRDRDRIIHSVAFRRLEYKTQVFVNYEDEEYRNRLTHTLEVAQITRSLARYLYMNEDLAETIALAHDLGHPPFGHAGEDALNEASGIFNHNIQSFRLVTLLEDKYARFHGINLSWETLEGIAKHNGPVLSSKLAEDKSYLYLSEYNKIHDLSLHTYASGEAQIASISDDIAYNLHDIDDGLSAGIFTLNQIRDLPIIGVVFLEMEKEYQDLPVSKQLFESLRKVMGIMIYDIFNTTNSNIKDFNIKTPDDIRNAKTNIVSFSEGMAKKNKELKKYLFENMYMHYTLQRMAYKGKKIISDLFEFYRENPKCLLPKWKKIMQNTNKHFQNACAAKDISDISTQKIDSDISSIIATNDLIANFTDRSAIKEHQNIFDLYSNKHY